MNASLFKSLWLSVILIAPTISVAMNSAPKKGDSIWDALARDAEGQYRRIYNRRTPMPGVPPELLTTFKSSLDTMKKRFKDTQSNEAGLRNLGKDDDTGGNGPILGQFKKYSDDWWNRLFDNCKGCQDKSKKINCEKLLNDNPQWKEVAQMKYQGKSIVMKRALGRYSKEQDACSVACALCAGGDPDSRDDSSHPHTALHLVAMNQDQGLFNLLMEMGADPNLKCMPATPIDFVPDAWRPTLLKFGGGKKGTDDEWSKANN
jgi:hypothetical protein